MRTILFLALAGPILSLLLPLSGYAVESKKRDQVALVHYCEPSPVKLADNNIIRK